MIKRLGKKTSKLNKLFVLYFLSYFAVIIIPVIFISIFSYNLAVNTLEDEISQSNLGSIKQISISINNLLHEFNTLSVHLGLDGKTYAYAKNTDNYFLLNDVKDTIKQLATSNEYIHSIDLYFNQNNLIVSSSGLTHPLRNSERDQWIDQIKSSGEASLWLPTHKYLNHDGNVDSIIKLTRKLPVAFPPALGYMSINIYEDKIAKLLREMENNPYTNIYILDESGEAVSSVIQKNGVNPEGTKTHMNKVLSADMEGYFVENSSSSPSLITYTKDITNGWVLMSETPLSYVLNKLSYIRKVTIIASIFLIFIGVIISYFLSKSMYHPIKKLIDQSKRYQKELALSFSDQNESEFTTISGVLDKVIIKNKHLQDSFKAQFPSLIERFIFNLLNNKFSSITEIKDKMEFLELELTTKNYTLFLIEIDSYSSVLETYSAKELNVYKFSVLNIAEEMIKKSFFKGLATEVNENQHVVLINLDNHSQQNIQDRLENVAIQIRDTITKICPFSVTISIGSIYDDISKVYLSYQEAIEVIKYKLTLGNNCILFYSDLQNNKEIDYFYPLHIERNMINNLKSGRYEDALHYLEELKKEISERPYLSYENIYRLYSRILDAAINVLLEMNITLRDVFNENYIIYKELAKRETVDSIHEWLCFVFKKIADYIIQQNRNNEKINLVIEYMDKNFTIDLSLDMIADHVNLNPTYLSRIFKQHIGKTVVEYLTIKRLEESKKQLTESELNIKEIAQSLGYNNINSYIRYFKKYEGITPGEYRKNYTNLKPPRKNA